MTSTASTIRNSQRGSIATFLLVGLVLAVVAVGGIYYIQKQNGTNGGAGKNNPSGITTSPTPKSPTPKASPSTKPHKTNTPSPVKSSPPEERKSAVPMPKTGPSDSFFPILVVGLLSGLTVGYIRSLRSIRNTLLD